jgi:translation initiation factor 4A
MTQEINFKSFDDMDFLNFDLMKGIFEYGFQNPSRIQNLTIKHINDGYDIIAQSQSGTGKTGAFSIGALSIVNPEENFPQVIILANTHELATQIHFVISNLSKHMNIKITLCIGGTSIVNQHTNGRSRDPYIHIRRSHVLIGTPGRIFDYIERRAFNPSNVKMFVMDEADALLKNDFIEQIKQIFKKLNEVCQIVIFSATYADEILEIADSITSDPKKRILMKHEELSLDLIKQYKVDVRYESIKYSTLADLYTKLQIGQCIIFVNSIATANNIEKRLLENGFGVGKIHGGLTSDARSSVLKDFRVGITRVLISTDVLSRGIDIEQIGIVINYDLPSDYAQYIHRIGRSGRFGKIGVAINFITNGDRTNLRNIETHYDIKIEDMPDPSVINNFLSGTDGHLKLNKN